MPSQPPPESDPKGGESDDTDQSVDKFSSLAKGLFGVPREELERREAEWKVEQQREPRKRRRPGGSA